MFRSLQLTVSWLTPEWSFLVLHKMCILEIPQVYIIFSLKGILGSVWLNSSRSFLAHTECRCVSENVCLRNSRSLYVYSFRARVRAGISI